ncbi:MAG: GGDEF domain-containing protein [Acidobacteriota bacterium]
MSSNLTTVSTSPVVLLGSPSDSMVESLARTLESWHYQVEVARQTPDALSRLDSSAPPPIALLDMDLPGATDILWEVRRHNQERRTWNILLSAHRDTERIRAALQCGADDFLVFPPDAALLDPSDLRVRIRVAERFNALAGRLQRQSSELRYHATHDPLTTLWNRESLISLIFQETDRVQRMKTPLTLMLLDLDDFSRVNHDFGYETGDRILMELAARFRRQLRSYDLIGRCGEDEFLLALPGCGLAEALDLGHRIRETILARPFPTDNETTTLTASIGIAVSRGRSPLIVLREAERALASAKLSGKDCVRSDAPEAWLLQPALAAD